MEQKEEMGNIIEIKNLYKNFGEVQAVKNLSFRVKKGELFAFLGVNGAGKSTTISIMCGLTEKTSGTVTIDGHSETDSEAIKSEIGVVFQASALDKALTVYDNLLSRAALYGISGEAFSSRLSELAEALDFKNILKRTVGTLSGGQRRRIDIARALIHEPKILILDEPTTGLDPQTRKTLWKVVDELRKKDGMTVFLTTHYMEEAVDADYVIILDKGEIAAEGTPLELKNTYTADYVTLYGVSEDQVKSLGKPFEKLPGAYRVTVKDPSEATRLIIDNPSLFCDYEIIKGKMDDVFLSVTGSKPEENNK